jgi:hypothetical protein
MRNRTVGILGGALLVGGIFLGIASGLTANRMADNTENAAGIHRQDPGPLPRHRGPVQPGQRIGDPGRRNFPGQGRPLPGKTTPTPG